MDFRKCARKIFARPATLTAIAASFAVSGCDIGGRAQPAGFISDVFNVTASITSPMAAHLPVNKGPKPIVGGCELIEQPNRVILWTNDYLGWRDIYNAYAYSPGGASVQLTTDYGKVIEYFDYNLYNTSDPNYRYGLRPLNEVHDPLADFIPTDIQLTDVSRDSPYQTRTAALFAINKAYATVFIQKCPPLFDGTYALAGSKYALDIR